MSGDSPELQSVDASGLKISIAAASYNAKLVGALLLRVHRALAALGVRERAISVVRVPGSNELPVAVRLQIEREKPDAAIALGVIVRGGTLHYELISNAATQGLQQVALESRIPVINGIVVAENLAQARARCQGRMDRGAEFAGAAVAMAALKRKLRR